MNSYLRRDRAAGRFERDRLPDAASYFEGEGLRLLGGSAWRSTVCPFHGDTRPSLRVNVESGAWRCMACGEHGGDVLDFHRKRHGLGFADAARALGAWAGGR